LDSAIQKKEINIKATISKKNTNEKNTDSKYVLANIEYFELKNACN
jgi:hypothetical protein